MSFLMRRGIVSSGLLGGSFATFNHTWLGGADIQGNQADIETDIDGVHFPHDSSFNFAGDDFTIEAILNWDSFPEDFPMMFSKWGAAGSRVFQAMYRNDTNAVRFAYTTDGSAVQGFDGAFTPTIGQEYHIAISRDGANIRLFVNGAQVGSTGNIGTDVLFSNSNRQMIGNYDESFDSVAFSQGNLDGQINYLKVSNIARYTAAFTAPSTLINDDDTLYLNTFAGANGSTPLLNTSGA